jgi:hypothetical protein
MKVELTKDYAIHLRTLPKGMICEVSKELAAELLKKKVAKKVKINTIEQSKFVDNESNSEEQLDTSSEG